MTTKTPTLCLLLASFAGGCVLSTPAAPGGPVCPDPADPEVHYVSQEPGCYETIFWEGCGPLQTYIPAECGCGCVGPEEPACPDPSDPDVHYVEGSHDDPTLCSEYDILCDEGQTYIPSECGCGCVGPEEPPGPPVPAECAPIEYVEDSTCPDPTARHVRYIEGSHEDPTLCYRVDFRCEEGETLFSDECGCGCIDCPDAGDPAVHYVTQDPLCQALESPLCECEPGHRYFTSPCGCGCIDAEPAACEGLDELACMARSDCAPCYAGFCDCTCPGPEGCEGGGCEGCDRSCFEFVGCHDAG